MTHADWLIHMPRKAKSVFPEFLRLKFSYFQFFRLKKKIKTKIVEKPNQNFNFFLEVFWMRGSRRNEYQESKSRSRSARCVNLHQTASLLAHHGVFLIKMIFWKDQTHGYEPETVAVKIKDILKVLVLKVSFDRPANQTSWATRVVAPWHTNF